VREVIATKTVHPRALDPDELVKIAHKYGCAAQTIVPIEDALEVALERAGSDVPILATGSLFVVAAVREMWLKETALLGI
jgi:folylpolyglutamate synthase/dihydropteroate synthase